MTHNLPARQPEASGPTGVPLSRTPTEALCFALGYVVARPVQAEQYGGVCALVEELMRRNARDDAASDRDPSLDGSLWAMLPRYMPAELARAVQTLYLAHRGQRWARTGKQGPPIQQTIVEGPRKSYPS